jgi:hypothetical protein
MKPTETTYEIISCITHTIRVIRESYKDYGAKIPKPQNNINGGISNHAFQTFLKAHNANMYNFFKLNLFWATLTPEIRAIIPQQDQQTMNIKKMYDIATTSQREGKDFKNLPSFTVASQRRTKMMSRLSRWGLS